MEQIIFIIVAIFCIYALTVICLVLALNKKDKQFAEERKDYLNRIMAKDSKEYINLNKAEIKRTRPLTDGEILGDDRFDGILN